MPASARATLYKLIQQWTKPHFSAAYLRQALLERGVRISDPLLRIYLSEAVRKGLVQDAGHSWYSRLVARVPLDLQTVRELIREMEKAFPLLNFSCCSTSQINSCSHHVLAQPTAFLYAAGDALPAVEEGQAHRGERAAVGKGALQGSELWGHFRLAVGMPMVVIAAVCDGRCEFAQNHLYHLPPSYTNPLYHPAATSAKTMRCSEPRFLGFSSEETSRDTPNRSARHPETCRPK